jgi:hypothetical protein
VRVGEATHLNLHFHFLDLTDHPCRSAFAPSQSLDASSARTSDAFQTKFLPQLQNLFASATIGLGQPTYDDLRNSPALDNVTYDNARTLLSLGKYSNGINVFLARSVSPIGMTAFGPTPGPAGIKGTTASGVILSMEPLCYLEWEQFTRNAAHQIARYMGLFPNRDLAGHLDPIDDTAEESDNLMFFSERGGNKLTPGQRAVLIGSPILVPSPVQQ